MLQKKIWMFLVFAGLAAVSTFGAGTTVDELGKLPQFWYTFVHGSRSYGEKDLTIEKEFQSYTDTERDGSKCAVCPTGGGYGKGIEYGKSNWTLLIRARSDNTDNAVIVSFGHPCNAKAGANLILASAGTNKVSICGSGGNAKHADLITATVPNAASSFHDYAIQRSGTLVSFWVDGVKVGEVTRSANPSTNLFQFFGCYGGIGNSGFVAATAAMSIAVAEFRFYTEALTADDLKTLAFPPCDECGYRPLVHLTFNGAVAEAEDSRLRLNTLEGTDATFTTGRAGADKTAYTFDGTHRVRGIGLPWGANTGTEGGDWSLILDAKVESTDNAVIFYGGTGTAGSSFSLASGGAGKVTFSAHSGTSAHADRITATVADAATAFHRYAIVRTGNNITLWVDGVSAGTIERANNPDHNGFSLLAPYAANSANGFVAATQSVIDDFRLYKRALTATDLQTIAAAAQDEIGETPVHWLKFNGDLTSNGKVAPTFTDGTDAPAFGPADAEAKTCLLGSGSLPQGTNLCWRSGSWTLFLRARSVDTDNAVIAAFGPSISSASSCFALASAGAGRIAFSAYSNGSTHADLLTGTVPDAASAFHDYVIRRDGTTVSLWVDSVLVGQITRPLNPTINSFAFATLPGGIGSGLVHDDAVAIDEFRLYERALTDIELCALSGISPTTDAWWTGAAGDNALTNAANWCCTNAANAEVANGLPKSYTTLHFTGAVAVPLPAGTTLTGSRIVFDCALAADLDWSGLDMDKISGTIDLAGHALTLVSLAGSATVTDTVGEGTLHLNVPSGTTLTGNGLSLTGLLRLVKEGAGIYVATKTQSYSGGTQVAAGTAKFGAAGNTLPFGATGSAITVAAGATLDANGYICEYPYPVTLAGGTLANSGASQSMDYDSFGAVTLTADATVKTTGSLSIRNKEWTTATLDLNGHTLTVNAASSVFRLCNCTATNGKIVVTPATSTLTLFGDVGNSATTVDFDIGGSLAPYAPSTVRDLTLRTACLYQTMCPATTTVTRVFTPLTTEFQNILLADGATLDVSSYDVPFALANTAHDDRVISFETGARVTVDVHGRTLAPGDQILSWTTRPAGVSFQLDAESAQRHAVTTTATGLYVVRGLIVILR